MTKDVIIVGNYEARKQLRKNVLKCIPTLLVGPNGIGKTSSVKELADILDLKLRLIYPLTQEEIVKEFGIGPTDPSNEEMYVVEADGLSARKFSILKNYIKNIERPFVIICQREDKLNKKLVKNLVKIEFTIPSTEDVENFIRNNYGWDGDINDIYDPDMRVVLYRLLTGEKIYKPSEIEKITAKDLAVELGFGYVKKGTFDKLEQPLWWVVRWLTFNQRLKFPRSPTTLLNNLSKLSLIDEYKFYGVDDYLHYMLLGTRGSPRRAFFKFPIWPKKKEEVDSYSKIDKAPEKSREKFDLSRWL